MTLETFFQYPMNIYAKFHSNASTTYIDIGSRETAVNGRTTDDQP